MGLVAFHFKVLSMFLCNRVCVYASHDMYVHFHASARESSTARNGESGLADSHTSTGSDASATSNGSSHKKQAAHKSTGGSDRSKNHLAKQKSGVDAGVAYVTLSFLISLC